MKCPVCKENRKMLEQRVYGQPPVTVDALLYQISYPGQKEYVSPRCSECMDKLLTKKEGSEREEWMKRQ